MAKDISELFGDVDEETVYKTIKDQKKYLDLLKDSNCIKRFILNTGMDLAHCKDFKDLLLTTKNDPKCLDSSLRLDKYFDKAVEHYPILAQNLIDYLNNKEELPPYFKHDFTPKEDYRSLPVLSYEEEKKYEVKDLQD